MERNPSGGDVVGKNQGRTALIRMGGCCKKAGLALLILLFLVAVVAGAVITGENFRIDRELLKQAEAKYGKDAVIRLLEWEEMIRQDRSRTDREKLEKTNHFFNSRIRFANDMEIWGVQDYWTTPFELLCKKAGDCEDFAIAKYFTLKAMGMEEEKLSIAYVKAIQYRIAHMVLTYYSEPDAEPLVLDNLTDTLSPASSRTDLIPVFSFNGSGLWTAKQRGKGIFAGGSHRIKPWQDLQQKMTGNKL